MVRDAVRHELLKALHTMMELRFFSYNTAMSWVQRYDEELAESDQLQEELALWEEAELSDSADEMD